MHHDTEVDGDVRFFARLERADRVRFLTLYGWMPLLGLSEAHLLTYAWAWSFTAAGLSTAASVAAEFLHKSERNIRKHFEAIGRAGLWIPLARFRPCDGGRTRIANAYLFLWHPAMPIALRGAPYVARATPLTDGRDGMFPGSIDTKVDVASVPDTVTPATGLLKISEASDQHARNKSAGFTLFVPTPVRSEVQRAFPGSASDCLRVAHEQTRGLPDEEARRVIIAALRALVARSERGAINNPPGLLRARLLPEAAASLDAARQELVVAKGELDRVDASLLRMRSGFAMLAQLRKREFAFEQYAAKHREVHGDGPNENRSWPSVSEPPRRVFARCDYDAPSDQARPSSW